MNDFVHVCFVFVRATYQIDGCQLLCNEFAVQLENGRGLVDRFLMMSSHGAKKERQK